MHMRRHLANKGKSVMRPIESGEEVAFPSSTEDASSTASGGAEITALVSGPSCHSDATTNSNVSAEVGGPVMDPTMVAAPFGNIVGVATTSGMSQVSVRPVAHLEPVGRRAGRIWLWPFLSRRKWLLKLRRDLPLLRRLCKGR